MNAKAFKTLIKEAVREAVREEIGILLLEQKKQALSEGIENTVSFTSKDVSPVGTDVRNSLRSKMGSMFGYEQPQSNLRVDPKADNPFMAFIEDAANNMSPQDLSGLRNLG
jgi:hypothetical protein